MKEILREIAKIAADNDISTPYLVGGIPRDIYLNAGTEFSDIDITTNSSDIIRLALLCCGFFNKYFKVFDDGHLSIYLDDNILDFSSHFISDSAVKYAGDISDNKLKEVYSRDFTMNTLHMDLSSLEIIDPLGVAKKDIDDRIIKTPVSPEISLTDDPNRIWRAVRFSSKLDFNIDEEIIDFIKENKSYFENHPEIKPAYIESTIGESMKLNPKRTLENLISMDILGLVPLSGEFKEELIKRRMIKDYLDAT